MPRPNQISHTNRRGVLQNTPSPSFPRLPRAHSEQRLPILLRVTEAAGTQSHHQRARKADGSVVRRFPVVSLAFACCKHVQHFRDRANAMPRHIGCQILAGSPPPRPPRLNLHAQATEIIIHHVDDLRPRRGRLHEKALD